MYSLSLVCAVSAHHALHSPVLLLITPFFHVELPHAWFFFFLFLFLFLPLKTFKVEACWVQQILIRMNDLYVAT